MNDAATTAKPIELPPTSERRNFDAVVQGRTISARQPKPKSHIKKNAIPGDSHAIAVAHDLGPLA